MVRTWAQTKDRNLAYDGSVFSSKLTSSWEANNVAFFIVFKCDGKPCFESNTFVEYVNTGT